MGTLPKKRLWLSQALIRSAYPKLYLNNTNLAQNARNDLVICKNLRFRYSFRIFAA